MISTDLSKALDSINYRGLITKFTGANIPNNLIKIIENYLSGYYAQNQCRNEATHHRDLLAEQFNYFQKLARRTCSSKNYSVWD
ncbi:hypothetical protein EVAR_34420_1 [Eumeta japonica]|uniref:Uncharacterized protein n=1 Tax=Eumeta variegata TaxID=151549 RepID=A0A4C1WN34_EUMVA|nr:hypothetical protein EVAR_34420_1 [Eumeta japonica]